MVKLLFGELSYIGIRFSYFHLDTACFIELVQTYMNWVCTILHNLFCDCSLIYFLLQLSACLILTLNGRDAGTAKCGQLAEYEVYYPEKMMNHMYDRIAGGYLALEVLG